MNNCSLEYIASGCSYFRINNPEVANLPQLNDYFQILNNLTDSHSFSLLFNGFTESAFGPVFQHFYKKGVPNIMVDSGGLQMVTLGKEATPQMKRDVYKVQSKYGNLALSFDEIPISFSGESSSRLDISNRWFDHDKLEECAKLTGRNVADQIQLFIDEKSKSRPIFIAQGNDYDTYMRWTELALAEIPKDHQKYIKGVAMGAAGLGFGELEDIKKAFYFSELPIETNHMHLLGIGAISRLVPYLVFSQSGIYKDLHISYDSTSHASSLVLGKYVKDGKIIQLPKKIDGVIYPLIYKNMQDMGFEPPAYDEMCDALNLTGLGFAAKYGNQHQYILTRTAYFTTIVYNFIKDVDLMFQSKANLMNNYKRKHVVEPLYAIKNKTDFDYWEKHLGQFVKSKSISTATDNKKGASMENFF